MNFSDLRLAGKLWGVIGLTVTGLVAIIGFAAVQVPSQEGLRQHDIRRGKATSVAHLVDESAAAAQSLQEEADRMKQAVSVFKLAQG